MARRAKSGWIVLVLLAVGREATVDDDAPADLFADPVDYQGGDVIEGIEIALGPDLADRIEVKMGEGCPRLVVVLDDNRFNRPPGPGSAGPRPAAVAV